MPRVKFSSKIVSKEPNSFFLFEWKIPQSKLLELPYLKCSFANKRSCMLLLLQLSSALISMFDFSFSSLHSFSELVNLIRLLNRLVLSRANVGQTQFTKNNSSTMGS